MGVFTFYLSGRNGWWRNNQSCSAPTRYVRTAKRNGDSLQPKSRLIIPGHLDSHSWIAVQIGVKVAVSLSMFGETFYVSAAFSLGIPTDRFIRAPPRALPSVGGSPKMRPSQLLQILKNQHGLTEAPRLWYPRAREHLTGPVGLTELRCARAVIVKHDARGKLKVILTLHLDDGFLFGTRSDPTFQRVKELIKIQFDTKGWEGLNNPDGVDYRGLRWKLTPEEMQADTWKYQQSKRQSNRKQLFVSCWHESVGQRASCAMSKTAQKPENEWTGADVKNCTSQ